MKLTIQSALPDPSVSHFVHSFWMLKNKTGKDVATTLLPNGMVDMMVINVDGAGWRMVVRGIDTVPSQVTIAAGTIMFSIGLKLLAVEYLLGDSIKDVLNEGKIISSEQWQYDEGDTRNLKRFCAWATKKIKTIATPAIDSRKQKLFDLIYSSHGSLSVKELSDRVYWSSRQINRYFNQQFGISLKAYCSILRFGTSFRHISEGRLFPEQHFTDQNHFIKETKKYAGVTPKALSKNKDDRFIDLVAIKQFPFKKG